MNACHCKAINEDAFMYQIWKSNVMILLKVLIRTLMNTKGIFGLLFKFCSASWLGKIKKGAKSAAVKGDPLKTNPFTTLLWFKNN